MIKTIRTSLFLGFLTLAASTALFAQPEDHPPIPQIDRTDNARDQQPTVSTAKPVSNINIDFGCKQYYRLVAIKAVDINHKHTATEMAAFNEEAEGEFTKTDIAIDYKAGMWYLKNKNSEGGTRPIAFTIKGNQLSWVNCTKCQDGAYTIVKHTDNMLVLQVQPQDEGQYFVYEYQFTK